MQEVDHRTRVDEAVAKAVVCALKGTTSEDNADDWLNPTEVLHLSYSTHLLLHDLNLCVAASSAAPETGSKSGLLL